MWRRNAPTLRQCTSHNLLQHGSKRWYSSERSSPVAKNKFKDALNTVIGWNYAKTQQQVGFAISGGVDSMALAALYHQARKDDTKRLPRAHGFIVDHKMRSESTEEANWVAQQLREKFDMDVTILSIAWPEGMDPTNTDHFESTARMLRYQALGKACRDNNIEKLMVAHHADDQAETAMMRLAKGRHRSGLQCMHRKEWIPECEGIHGVFHSGGTLAPRSKAPFPIEQGGIELLRPLLGFEKSELIATCEDQGVKWAEDKTNQVQTLTMRNAVRHMWQKHRLPEALSIKSLAKLSLNMQRRVNAHKNAALELMNQCRIRLDVQSSCLFVRFPTLDSLISRPIETELDRIEAKDNVYFLLQNVAGMVSPLLRSSAGQVTIMIPHIYPELNKPGDMHYIPPNKLGLANRCVYGVWWRPWDKAMHPREWVLSRQPALEKGLLDPSTHIVYPPVSPEATPPNPKEEPFQLCDGRYWIRLRNYTKDTLSVRIIGREQLQAHLPIKKTRSLPKREHGQVAANTLMQIVPIDLRYTLPAVFRTNSETGTETLVGFPTLDVSMEGPGAPTGVCDWEVRYKKIELGRLKPDLTILPAISRAQMKTGYSKGQKEARVVVNLVRSAGYGEGRKKPEMEYVRTPRPGKKGSELTVKYKGRPSFKDVREEKRQNQKVGNKPSLEGDEERRKMFFKEEEEDGYRE